MGSYVTVMRPNLKGTWDRKAGTIDGFLGRDNIKRKWRKWRKWRNWRNGGMEEWRNGEMEVGKRGTAEGLKQGKFRTTAIHDS